MKPPATCATIAISPHLRADYPLSRDRIAVYNSGIVPATRYDRDSSYFERTRPEHLRIDLGWGPEWMPRPSDVVHQDARVSRYDFEDIDHIAQVLKSVDVQPYWSYCYVPAALQPPGSDWRTMPVDDSSWVDLVRTYVAGARERGVSIGYHEVYNEPDLRDERTGEAVFYSGDLEDYLDLYRTTSRAIREADPTALVGGPALALPAAHQDWIRRFLATVKAESLPLDFLSFHLYGSASLPSVLREMDELVDEAGGFENLELHLNEYNSFPIDYPRGGLQDSYLLASAFAADAAYMLSRPTLTKVSWAQFLDSGQGNFSGMVSIEGAAKPLYHVYEFLQAMPVDRSQVTVQGPEGLGALASSDSDGIAVLAWNRSTRDLDVTIHLPANVASCFTRLIDSEQTGEESLPVALANGNIHLQLNRGAVALVDTSKRNAKLQPRVLTRVRYHYGDRSSTAWADADRHDAVLRFGTATDPRASLRLDVTLPLHVDLQPNTTVCYADGSPAPGVLHLDTVSDDHGQTVVASLTGAPAGVFATVRLLGNGPALWPAPTQEQGRTDATTP